MKIHITQYIRLDGHQADAWIDNMPGDLAPILKLLADNGMRLAGEVLTTGVVSFTVESLEHETDFEIELAQNGPGPNGTAAALERMLRRCTPERIAEWLAAVRE